MSDKEPIDITAFDAVTASEEGYEFELENTDGTGTGVFVTVRGRHSDVVVNWATKKVNESAREQQLAARKGKVPDPKPIEELREQNREGAVTRVIGWRNVKQPYSAELMKQALKRNPHWIEQITEESDNLANFTKRQ